MSSVLVVASYLALAMLPTRSPAQTIWDGGSTANGNWSTAANWNNNIAPTTPSGSVLHFAGTVRLASAANAAWTVNGLAFDSGAGAFTISGSALTIGSSGVVNNDDSLQTISNAVVMSAAQTFQTASTGGLTLGSTINNGGFLLSTNAASATTITFNGVVSGAGGLTKSGSGTTLLNAVNTYTGAVTINGGTLAIKQLTGLGSSSSGAANLVINGGTLSYVGTAAGSSTRDFTIGTNGATIDASGTTATNTLTFNTAITLTGTNTARTLTLTGSNTGNNTMFNVIANNGTGVTNVVKQGAGTWVFDGTSANTYSGDTTVNAGTLILTKKSGSDATGTGNIIIGDGVSSATVKYLDTANQLANNTGIYINDNGTFDLAGFSDSVGFFGNGSSATGGTGRLILGAATLTTTANTSSAFSGTISGTGGSLIKSGTGTLTLSGANTYTGTTTISQGTISAGSNSPSGSSGALGNATSAIVINDGSTGANATGLTIASSGVAIGRAVTVANSGTGTTTLGGDASLLSGTGSFTGAVTLGRTTTLQAAGTSAITFGGILSGSGGITKSGTGTVVLSGTNTFTGVTTLNGGTLSVATIGNGGVPGNLGQATNAAANLVYNNGTLQYTGATASTNRNFTINSGTTGTIDVTTNNLTISGSTTATSGNLTKTGAGTLTLSGTNLYTGVTTLSNGTLSVATIGNGGVAGNLGNATNAAANLVFDGGTLQYTGTTAATNRSFTINAGKTATFDVTANNLTLSGAAAATTGSLVKTGAGTLTLSGANAFTGGVTVNAGTLAGTGTTNVGGFAALGNYTGLVANTDVVTVNSGATLSVQSTYTADSGNGTTTSFQNLVLNGTGVSGGGALRSVGGNSTWTGNTVLGSDATITNAAAVGGANELFIGAFAFNTASNLALNNHTLTINGPGDTYITSKVGSGAGDTGSVIINGATSNTTVTYAGYTNYYTGSTTLNSGQLYLRIAPSNPANSAILGNLTIGSNSSTTTAKVIDRYLEQISDSSQVTINSDGTLDLATHGVLEIIGSLVLNGGTVSTGTGELHIANGSGTVSVATANTSTIDGKFRFLATDGTIDVASSSTLLMSADLFGTNITKTGNGKMIMTYDNQSNGYAGVTTVSGGTLNIQNSGALGALSAGTVVSNGATLQLENTSANVQVGAEALTLNGTGYASQGALDSKSGADNRYGGAITLGSSSTIMTDSGNLTINGSIKGTAATSTTQTLTMGGAGNSEIHGAITNGTAGGTLAVTKVDAGTLTLTGANTFTGALAVNAGTVSITVNNSLGAHTNAVSVASAATFAVSGGSGFSNTIGSLTGSGMVSIAGSTNLVVATPSADTFDGRLTGTGLFEKSGAGTFTFSSTANTSAFNFAGTVQLTATATADTLEFKGGTSLSALTIGTLQLTGGTLLLTNSYINVGTLNITGNTILDFGTSGASILNATNIYIASGAVLTIKNWNSEVDFLFANSDFRQDNSSGTIAIQNAIGSAPENQVKFFGDPQSPDGSHTTWIDNATNYYSYADNEIRPVPEPSTYGAFFIAGSLAFLGWRRRRSGQSQLR